nr:telomere repeats-binding bouquet formation protein 1 isoform X2 [Misgurnus anguillicaudatus]
MEAIKTDLRLLLECLKYQMKWPDSQKQALLTILSICQQNGQYVEFFREIGGISFIYNLSKSSSYSEVKQTALFTLASVAESHESCKQTLCREETFRDLAHHLEQEIPLTHKRVAVYMLGVLVANNRCGQTFAKTSRCIEVLLSLFRHSFPEPNDSYEQLQFWVAVSSALCSSVNNPQNEENQNVCSRVFPMVITWLQEVQLPRAELAQPICSFIGMTVANNSSAQEYFVSAGGLDSLSNTLNKVLPHSAQSMAACKMATVIIKTLSACISNNELLVSSLSNLRVIPGMLCLLSNPNLDPQDQIAVVVTIGQLTDACVEHQFQLLLAGGLALMISLLTESPDEEVRRAAMFVLHTCKRITESMCGDMSSKVEEECDMEKHRQSAAEILQRIQQLEEKIGGNQLERDGETQRSEQKSTSSVEFNEEWWGGSVKRKVKGYHQACQQGVRKALFKTSEPCLSPIQVPVFQRTCWEKSKESEQTRETESSSQMSNDWEIRREKDEEQRKLKSERVAKKLKMITTFANPHSEDKCYEPLKNCSMPTGGGRDTEGPDIFRHPHPRKRNQFRQTLSDDEISLCSELLDKEIERFLKPPPASVSSSLRCAGCVKLMHEVDSRSFGAMMRSCRHQCDFHLVLQEAEDRYRRSQQLERASHTLTRACISTPREKTESSAKGRSKLSHRDTPQSLWKRNVFSLTPLKRPCETDGSNNEEKLVRRNLEKSFDKCLPKNSFSGRQRDRKNWSADELLYLNEGVKRFGHSWNSILWAYPFLPRRTNVDLAQKYQRMQKAKAQGLDRSDEGNI